MKKYLVIFFAFFSMFLNVGIYAQVEGILVEKYYIAGSSDTLSFGHYQKLDEGSVTYRVFLDLEEGASLVRLFGDEIRPFVIASTKPFFNHADRGYPFGFQIRETLLDRDVLALDTWLTIGHATRNHFGIPKDNDPDGSLDLIKKNREDDVLTFVHPEAGKPISESDGLVPKSGNYSFGHSGIINVQTQEDTVSIFSVFRDTIFSGTSFFLQDGSLKGVMGANQDNHVLIAQLTTKGEISFRINAEVKNKNGDIYRIFGTDTLIDISKNERYSSWMSYPVMLRKGCMNPYFVQYDPKAEVDDGTWCKDSIVFGCLDPTACNYSGNSNYHLPELCCYDSTCALDLEIVCPGIVFGCMDPLALNFNPLANTPSAKDKCCYTSGCTDNRYLEYNRNACYHDSTACKTIIIRGCMDKNACNYNPFANQNSACIYTGCGEKSAELESKNIELDLYPNPAKDEVNMVIRSVGKSRMFYEIWDPYGKMVSNSENLEFSDEHFQMISLDDYKSGIYFIRISINREIIVKRLVKY